MHFRAETEPSDPGGDRVRNGEDSHGICGGHREKEQRREQAPYAESGHRRNRSRDDCGCSNEPGRIEYMSSSPANCCLLVGSYGSTG
jgi:hypothetical protein